MKEKQKLTVRYEVVAHPDPIHLDRVYDRLFRLTLEGLKSSTPETPPDKKPKTPDAR